MVKNFANVSNEKNPKPQAIAELSALYANVSNLFQILNSFKILVTHRNLINVIRLVLSVGAACSADLFPFFWGGGGGCALPLFIALQI